MLSALSFIKDYGAESNLQIGLNVSPIFDMQTTNMIKGEDDVWYMNGGLMPINALAGGNNTQKTGRLVKDCAALLHRFRHATILYGDTESTLDVNRLAEEVNRLYGIENYFEDYIEDRDIVLLGPHLKYLEDDIKDEIIEYGVPYYFIPDQFYSTLNGVKVVEFAIEKLEEKK